MRLNCIFEIILARIWKESSTILLNPLCPPSLTSKAALIHHQDWRPWAWPHIQWGWSGSLALMGACHRGSKSGRSLSWKEMVVAKRAGVPAWMTALPLMQVWGSGDSRVPLHGCPTTPGHHLHADWAAAFYSIQDLVAGQQCPGWQWTSWQRVPDLDHHSRWERTFLHSLQNYSETCTVESILLFPFCWWRNWGPERLINLSKLTQVEGATYEI